MPTGLRRGGDEEKEEEIGRQRSRREVGRDGTSTDTGPHWNSIVNPKP